MWKIYSKVGDCVYCELARGALTENNIEFMEIKLDTVEKRQSFKDDGFRTVPQIFDAEGNHIGGWEELRKKLYE